MTLIMRQNQTRNYKQKQSSPSSSLISSLPESIRNKAIEHLYQGKSLTGKDGIFGNMIKDILETALSEELNQHLKQEKLEDKEKAITNNNNDDDNYNTDNIAENDYNFINNRRNGYNSKTLKTKDSAFKLDVPRDRNNSFNPQIVKK